MEVTARVRCAVMAATCLAAAAPLAAQVRGRVTNGTDGGPAGGVALTLSSFLGGMTPVEEVVSGADGRFAFTKDLPAVSANQPFAGAIRAEFEGIGYTEVLESASLGREVEHHGVFRERNEPPSAVEPGGHSRAERRRAAGS